MTNRAPPSPEFALAAACCHWPPSDRRHVAVRAAAAAVTDWSRFLEATRRQRVDGLVHDALGLGGVALPPEFAQELATRAQRISRRSEALAAESVRLQRALGAEGIASLVLKGAALAQLAYGSLKLKQSRDIDLLVPADRAESALRLLEDDGYARVSPAGPLNAAQRRAMVRYGKEVELALARGNIRLELQWLPAVNPLLLKGIDAHAAPQTVCLGNDAAVRTLADDDLFAYLCVHGACHSWSRLKWLADLNAWLTAKEAAALVDLYRHAESTGAGLCAGQALLLCRRVLGLPLPPALETELRADKRIERLAAIAMDAMTRPHVDAGGDLAEVTRNVLTPFLLGRGWAYFAAQCRAMSVGMADVSRVPLHPSLHFLYPLLRIPLWLWRRARRSGSASV